MIAAREPARDVTLVQMNRGEQMNEDPGAVRSVIKAGRLVEAIRRAMTPLGDHRPSLDGRQLAPPQIAR